MRGTAASPLLLAVAIGAAACAPALRPLGGTPSALSRADEAEAAAAKVHALARRVEQEPSSRRRAELAVEAVEAGQRCEAAAPDTAPCDYALAIALGIQARERPSTVRDGLAKMAARLRSAAAARPRLDQAGPYRILALLLLRAPGWPLGPGDPEAGLEAARKAVELAPDHAPNQAALAEALLAAGEEQQGRAAAHRALQLAEAAEAAGVADAAAWKREARRLADAP